MKTTILTLFAAIAILAAPAGAVTNKKWECVEAKNCKGQHDVKQKPLKGYVYSNGLAKKTRNGAALGGVNSSRPDRR